MIFFKYIRTIKLLSLILLCSTDIFALKPDVPKGKKINLNTSAFNLVDSNGTFDGNQIYLDLANNGFLVDYHISGDSGLEWPQGTGAHTIFQSALWMGATVNGQIRTIVGDYTQDMGPGPWGGDPLAAVHRIYKIDKDMLKNPTGHKDFQEWPTQFGAPWVDVDGDGVYSPLPNGPDHPEFIGDQVLWFVSNDGDPRYKLNFGTSPLNVEMQTTIYGFNRPHTNNDGINWARDPLGDAVFYRILVINKGSDDLIDTYMGLWVDPDLGYAGDDFVGCDVELGMGYVWNDGDDSTYANWDIGTPAAGYDFFQGPMVPCDASEDCSEGAKMFGTRHPGMKNLQMSSFAFYINGDATYTDPADEEEGYYYLQGLRKDGTPYPTDIAGDLYDQKFCFYGDPNDAAGHSSTNPVDGNYTPSADRRFLMSVGPFTMAAGDSQEVVFGIFHAAGGDALASVAYLKEVDAWIEEAYDNNFILMEEYNNAKPDIELFAGERSGVAPFTTSFTYNSSSELTYIGWDIDNDGVIDSSSENPTFTFLQSGTYDIKFFYGNTEYVSENRSGYTLQLQYKSLEITVVDPNEIFISDSSISTVEDNPISHDLEISNPENTEYRLNISQNPIHGSVYFNANKLIYSPKENFYGEDSLKIYASTINSNSNTALISISVSAQDDEPSAIDLVKTILEDSSTEITLDAYEYDGDSIVFEITSNPLHGSLSDLSDQTVIYTPDDDWYGVDKFYFKAEDAQGRSRIATAVINVTPVNDPPLTADMSIQSYEDQQTPIVLDVSDPENDTLELTFTNPNHGSITHEPGTAVIIYSPNENYFGQDSLQFVAQDYEFLSNTSTIAISLNPVNDPPSNFESSGQTLVSSTIDSIKPVASNMLFITPENINDSLRFQWNESFDIDGDKVQYQLVGNGDLEFLSTDEWTDELTISLALKDIIAQTDTLSTIQGDWLVRAYDGEFEILSNEGQGQPLALNGSALIPEQFNLNQNFPNPFSNTTTLRYDLKTEMLVQIYIYDLQGRKINTLLDEIQSPGFKTLLWDGKSSEGVDVASGIYFVQMHLKSLLNDEKFIATKKITKIKN